MSWNRAPSTSRSGRSTRSARSGGVGRRLPEVTIDREPVIGVALRPRADRLPLGQHPREDAAAGRAPRTRRSPDDPGESSATSLAERTSRPGLGPRPGVDLGGQPVEAGSRRGMSRSAAMRAARSASVGSAGGSAARRQLDLAVDEHDARRDALLVTELVTAQTWRQAPSAIHAMVRAAAAMSAIRSSAEPRPDPAATASWSSRRSTSPARPVDRCRATRASTSVS